MRCCHGNGLNPKIEHQKISLILTVPILINLYRENCKNGFCSKLLRLHIPQKANYSEKLENINP